MEGNFTVPQKINHRDDTVNPVDSLRTRNSTPRWEMKNIIHTKNLYSNVHGVTAKTETTQTSINWWLNKMRHIHTMRHYSDEVLTHITTWMSLENIMLSERSQTHKYQFSSVTQSCPTLCDPMNRSTPGLLVHHQPLEFTQTHVHRVGDAIRPSHPLSSPPPALNLSQHQGLFKRVSSSHQVAKLSEFQLQHQPFQWTPRIDPL